MDPEEDQKRFQRFLSFANFYFSLEHFADGFFTAHLHLCSKFSWSPEAETAFHMTLSRFASLSVLQTPDPKLQSIVEVDTSEVGSEPSFPSVPVKITRSTPMPISLHLYIYSLLLCTLLIPVYSLMFITCLSIQLLSEGFGEELGQRLPEKKPQHRRLK